MRLHQFFYLWLFALLSVALAPFPVSATQNKILYVDSYGQDYPWSAGIARGIEAVLKNHKNIQLKMIHMDTKRHNSEEFKIAAASQAKALIDSWQPQVVIASEETNLG